MTDLALAALHHVLVFLLVSLLAVELALVRAGMSGVDVARVARIDGAYGGIAALVLVAGVLRVIFGMRGWEFYVFYWVFWAKMAAFVVTGLMSVPPTLRFRRWAAHGGPVPEADVARVRGWLVWQALVLATVPVFAAMMARGVGY